MLDKIAMAFEKIQWYIGDSWQYILFVAAILYLIFSKEEKEHKRFLVGYTILFGIIYVCPLTAKIIADYLIGANVYWRMLWALPIPLIMAYVGTRIWQRQKGHLRQILCFVVFTALIAASGRFIYGADGPFVKAGNPYKLPPEVIWISDIILENAPESGTTGVVAPTELVGYIRQYDARLKLAYGRRGSTGKRRKRIRKEMASEQPNFKAIARRTRKIDVNFLVYPADEWQEEVIWSLGYEEVGRVNTYIIYRDTMIE